MTEFSHVNVVRDISDIGFPPVDFEMTGHRLWYVVWGLFTLISIGCTKDDAVSRNMLDARDSKSTLTPLAAAKDAVQRGDISSAESHVRQAVLLHPKDAAVLEFAGDVSSIAKKSLDAVAFYQSAIDSSSPATPALLDKLGQQWMTLGHPFDAIKTLQTAVALHPNEPSIHANLAGLLAAMGMEIEAAPHLQWLVMRGKNGLSELIMLSDLSRPQEDVKMCQYAIQHQPDDLRPQYPLCRADAYRDRWQQVSETLQPIVEKHPQFVLAQAYYGRSLVELGRAPELSRWAASLPATIVDQAQYWIAAGVWAETNHDYKVASKAYWQAAKLEVDNGEALNRLASALAKLGLNEPAKRFADRAGLLAKLRDTVDVLHSHQNNSQRIAVQVAKQMDLLGRQWEAAAWLRAGANMNLDIDTSLADVYTGIRAKLSSETPWQIPATMLARGLDLDSYPNVEWSLGHSSVANHPRPESNTKSRSKIHFTDQASQRNLNHICKVAQPAHGESGLWIYQSGAGGAAAIDFDLDGWPDVYLSTIDGTPKKEDSGPNRLYRNLAGRFIEVTNASATGDKGFSQGLAVGDFNRDGFGDLYVGNIGRNHLFQNNGDGTFTDVTAKVGLSGDDWTTSVAMVDIDQDGYLDLFDVGYCAGREAFEIPCLVDGRYTACLPKEFAAQKDRVWKGRADGQFTDVTENWLGDHDPAHGLGIIAGRLDDVSGIDVYVANDMSANHFWSSSRQPGADFRLLDQATMRGVAVDHKSLSQASMGIAAGDPDLDGDIDFFLTNFSGEYNAFYEQIQPGIWTDNSTRVGLAIPSEAMLGFGTQFFDADNDGTLELIVANGHVNDSRDKGEAYRMPTQVFQRSFEGDWSLVDPTELGVYFASLRLSRSVITLDVNRDGKIDTLVTHLFDPVSLLVNETDSRATSLTLFFKSTTGHPDSIGTKATARVGDKTYTSQLLAGNGYQCFNESCLRFGLGDAKEARVTIEWPSGQSEEIGTLAGNGEYLVIEGSGEAFSLGLAR